MNDARRGLEAITSRREVIAAGLAIAGSSTLGLAGNSSSANKIVFGSDRSGYAGLHNAAPLAVGLRWYFNEQNVFPSAWPTPFPGAHMTLSLRPKPQRSVRRPARRPAESHHSFGSPAFGADILAREHDREPAQVPALCQQRRHRDQNAKVRKEALPGNQGSLWRHHGRACDLSARLDRPRPGLVRR